MTIKEPASQMGLRPCFTIVIDLYKILDIDLHLMLDIDPHLMVNIKTIIIII